MDQLRRYGLPAMCWRGMLKGRDVALRRGPGPKVRG